MSTQQTGGSAVVDAPTDPPTRPTGGGIVKEVGSRLFQSEQTFLPVLLGLVIIATFFQAQNSAFLSSRNISNLILQVSIVGIVAAGMVLVLLTGEIDLSVGSIAGVSAAVFAILLERSGASLFVSFLGLLSVGLVIGLINALLTNVIGAPSFVVTLAALLGWQGVQLQILQSQTINVFNTTVTDLASTYLAPLAGWLLAIIVIVLYAVPNLYDSWQRNRRGLEGPPMSLAVVKTVAVALLVIAVVFRLNQAQGIPLLGVLFITVVAVLASIMKRTRYGRYVYAVGNSRQSARRAGVNVPVILGSVFLVSGLLASVGGFIAVSREAASTTLTGGGTFLLEVIAAAVIGGTSLFGGRGTVWSALLGALVVGSLSNGLDLTGRSGAVKLIVEGLILALAISADAILRRRQVGGS